MSPIKWRMLDLLLTDAIESASTLTPNWYHLRVAREIVRDQLDLKKIPHQSYLHRKMRS